MRVNGGCANCCSFEGRDRHFWLVRDTAMIGTEGSMGGDSTTVVGWSVVTLDKILLWMVASGFEPLGCEIRTTS
jgi:hypothetical protein